MKKILFSVLERGNATDELYSDIIDSGYNGTLIKTQSLKHVLHNDSFKAVLSLSQIAEDTHEAGQNATIFVIVEEEKLEALKEMIRSHTDTFSTIHGAMFVLPIDEFEGSF